MPLGAFDMQLVQDHFGLLLHGLWLTVQIATLGFALAVVIALPLAMAGLSASPLVRVPASVIVGIARGVPLLILIFWLYYAAADRNLFTLRDFVAGVLALGITGAGYMAENYRTALLAVPKGQREAAAAIGLSRLTAFGTVVFWQALRTAFPPAINLYVQLFKGATLLSVIGVADMFYEAKIVAVDTFRPFELYTAAAVMIIVVILLLSGLASVAERRLSRGYR